jgi:arsenite methyltransferase
MGAGVSDDEVRDQVRDRYARAATAVTTSQETALGALNEQSCCSAASCGTDEVDIAFGSGLYSADEQDELPAAAIAASLGCGNPMAVADLRLGETVLDLGSGGGIDVLLSARRVGPTGFAYGVDMTDEMLSLAATNQIASGLTNVEFLKGTIEAIPLADESVNVVISNCVINLSTDKPAVLAEMFRVLTPGGRIGVSDVVAEDHLTTEMRAERGSHVGCIAGALSRSEYLDGLTAAGFVAAEVEFTHEAAPGMHAAIVRASKPAQCCPPGQQTGCCESSAKASCCGPDGASSAGACDCQ